MSLDEKIFEKFLNKTKGIFVEVGANDGVIQSNTILLEKINNWSGILIEPSICLKEELIKNRKNCIIEMCAISDREGFINGDFNGKLMSSVDGNRLQEYYKASNLEKPNTTVPCYTLTSICKKHNIFEIDFCSIDVEGHEYSVLKGIDFTIINIKSFVIEVYKKDESNIFNFLTNMGYKVENLSNYTKHTHPGWDETHQDYFFYKD